MAPIDGQVHKLAAPAEAAPIELAAPADDAPTEPLDPLPKPKPRAAATLAGGLAAALATGALSCSCAALAEEPRRAVATGLDHAWGALHPFRHALPPASGRRGGFPPWSLPPCRGSCRTPQLVEHQPSISKSSDSGT